MIVWLTGNSGSGKTTLANRFRDRHSDWINLDGQEMRVSISTDEGFSDADREKHNLRVARLAYVLDRQGHNIMVSVIAPFRSTRSLIGQVVPSCLWVYIKRRLPVDADRPYEESAQYPVIDTDSLTVDVAVKHLEELILESKK